MALTPSTASYAITDAYLLATGLDSAGKPNGNLPTGDYPAAFATGYNDYAKEGTVLGAENSGGNKSIIENFMRGVSSRSQTITDFAQALANYWATVAVATGLPMHGGTEVISVSNDAASHLADFEAAIRASITQTESKPYFHQFVSNIETMAVRKIIWTVTELMPSTPPAPMVFFEGIL